MSEVKKIATRESYGKTLAELGSVSPNALSYPEWDSETGELYVYVDTR